MLNVLHTYLHFIEYFMQDNFKYLRIMKIHQVHQKLQTKTILIILLNLFSICNTFEFKASQIFR